MPADLSSPPLLQTATPDPLGQAEVLAQLHALLRTCEELQARVRDLELTERLLAARLPAPDLGIDY